jgi:hypothetical protein
MLRYANANPAPFAHFTFLDISRVIAIILEVANGCCASLFQSHNQSRLSSCLVRSFLVSCVCHAVGKQQQVDHTGKLHVSRDVSQ